MSSVLLKSKFSVIMGYVNLQKSWTFTKIVLLKSPLDAFPLEFSCKAIVKAIDMTNMSYTWKWYAHPSIMKNIDSFSYFVRWPNLSDVI